MRKSCESYAIAVTQKPALNAPSLYNLCIPKLSTTMKKAFRKYHRIIGIIVALPIALTVLTGMAITMLREWPLGIEISSRFLLKIHTGEIFHLQAIYPILNGLGMLGLLVTGLSMSGLFGRRKQPTSNDSN
ncbi:MULTISPECIES: peptidase [unclassified Microcoleus]|uniref:peptidase n=1 Tax=unclassified Microcoleus TaxID=2642155 RepID=UPI002FD54945